MRKYFLRLLFYFIIYIVMYKFLFFAKEYFGKGAILFLILLVLILFYIIKYSVDNSHRLTMRKIEASKKKAKELGYSEKESPYYFEERITYLEKKIKSTLNYRSKQTDEGVKDALKKQYDKYLKEKELNQERLKKHPYNSRINRFSRFLDSIFE